MEQLALDRLLHEPGATVERIAAERPMLLSSGLVSSGGWIELTTAAGIGYCVEMRVARPASVLAVTLPGRYPLPFCNRPFGWNLLRGLPLRGAANDVLRAFTTWAHDEIFGPPHDRIRARPGERWPATRIVSASRALAQVYHRARVLARHAADRCDPAARAVALRFAPHLRSRIYERLLDDSTGRIAQLAGSCPGAIIFAFALAENGPDGIAAGRALLDAAVAGKRLTPILDESVDAWASCARDILLQSEHDPLARGNPAWRRVRDTTGEARRELLVEQRLLVRRAASTVSTTLLWLPPPLTFAPGDLPRTARNSARWFRIMKSSGATLFCDDHDAASRYALSRFASRHAVTLYRLIGRGRVRAAMGELRDFLVATGRGVGRDADPERLLLASRAWHRRLARIGALAEPGSPGSAPVDATPFPDVPGGDFAGDGVAARAIRSVPELHQEGERMRHCVASRLREILTGRSYIFSVTVLARPLTVELCQRGGALHLGEVRGLANRIPAPAELEALRPWLARLRVRSA